MAVSAGRRRAAVLLAIWSEKKTKRRLLTAGKLHSQQEELPLMLTAPTMLRTWKEHLLPADLGRHQPERRAVLALDHV